ncbi:MAG: hypothetical protein ACRENA_04535 [Vulcanimicrobiaceae bacterium]
MRYDDARLDRALAALPLEEPPPDLRSRILLATVHRAVPVFQTWELWTLGVALALCTWVVVMLVAAPQASDEVVRATFAVVTSVGAGLVNPALAIWFGIGAAAALAFGLSENALAVLRRERP